MIVEDDTMELFADPITVNCRKVLAGLQLLGADYELTKVDYFAGEQAGRGLPEDQSECSPAGPQGW